MKLNDRRVSGPAFAAIALLFALGSVADSDFDKAIDKCAEDYRKCSTSCNQSQERYTNKKRDCDERQRAEDKRHDAALENCAGSWDRYRETIKKNYENESRACTTDDCRTKTLNGYNLLFNGSWIGQYTCEQAEGTQHEDKQNEIDADCADYDQNPMDVGRECRGDCVTERNECIRNAREEHGDSSGSGAERRKNPCPPGTRPNPLGSCVAVVRAKSDDQGSADGCPPGIHTGTAGRLYPKGPCDRYRPRQRRVVHLLPQRNAAKPDRRRLRARPRRLLDGCST